MYMPTTSAERDTLEILLKVKEFISSKRTWDTLGFLLETYLDTLSAQNFKLFSDDFWIESVHVILYARSEEYVESEQSRFVFVALKRSAKQKADLRALPTEISNELVNAYPEHFIVLTTQI